MLSTGNDVYLLLANTVNRPDTKPISKRLKSANQTAALPPYLAKKNTNSVL